MFDTNQIGVIYIRIIICVCIANLLQINDNERMRISQYNYDEIFFFKKEKIYEYIYYFILFRAFIIKAMNGLNVSIILVTG